MIYGNKENCCLFIRINEDTIHFNDATINQNIKRERKEKTEQRKGESKEKVKERSKEKTLRECRALHRETFSCSIYIHT
jgi:hypothetical protein